ncbi:MnhB domain-containing protein [Haloarcula marina]|uniref:MnhB domain-containing protein n=1 Tax=Haloarcula marina TaxID=2961574 RepID=UPI0020B8E06A|nr:MnhB domain-containing protein [Halomicroarcula marina]
MKSDDAAPSYVVQTVVRLLVPFVAIFGLFVAFHGATSAGGGFQGGVVVGTAVVLLALVFGNDDLRHALDRPGFAVLAVSGVVIFAGVGLGSLLLGGSYLQYDVYPLEKATTYGIELVELGIGATVTAVVVLFFFGLAGESRERPAVSADDREVTDRD